MWDLVLFFLCHMLNIYMLTFVTVKMHRFSSTTSFLVGHIQLVLLGGKN